MKIYIYPLDRGRFQVAINSKQGSEDYVLGDWQAVLELFASLKAPLYAQ